MISDRETGKLPLNRLNMTLKQLTKRLVSKETFPLRRFLWDKSSAEASFNSSFPSNGGTNMVVGTAFRQSQIM